MLRRENFDFKIVIVNLFEYIVLIFNYCNRKDRFVFFKVRFYIYNGENCFLLILWKFMKYMAKIIIRIYKIF